MNATENRSLESPGRRLVTGFVVAETALLIGNLLVRMSLRGGWLPFWGVVAIALVSAVPLLWFALKFFRMLRGDLDEMIQRVVLEGMAWALVIVVPLAGFYVNARTAGLELPRLDPPELLLAVPLFVALGILIAWGRLK